MTHIVIVETTITVGVLPMKVKRLMIMGKTLLGHIPNKNMNIRLFEYKHTNGYISVFPFRVGDIVKVKDWGKSYSSYKGAFKYFTGSTNPPYYSSSFLNWDKEKEERENAGEFKIIGVAEHSMNCRETVSYIRDRIGRGQVIGLEGLELVKQLPLRIGEKTIIKLEKLKS